MAACPAAVLAHLVLKPVNGLIGYFQAHPASADGEAQEAAVPGTVHGTLSRIHCEPQRGIDKAP
ncbi:hypothetical protein GCM10008094_09810 [Aidingimonas halophila]|nr:hypothetical protein GCM10008094_09810 [Aidingimonas halophila]